MSTLSGSAKAGSESGLKVRLYAILSPKITMLMQCRHNCVQQGNVVVKFVAQRGAFWNLNQSKELALQAACPSRELRFCRSETKAVQNTGFSRG
jgi:hypothetical protein